VRHLLLLVSFAFLTAGCAEDMAAYSPPPESPTSVVQNLHYTTNIYNTPTSTFAIDSPPVRARPAPVTLLPAPTVVSPPLPTPTLPTPTGTGISIITPPVAMVRPPEVLPRNVSPVGIASCDAYLTHVEFCSRRMLSKLAPRDAEEATAKIVMSLDMSRRAWKNAIPDMTSRARASLAETCADSIRLYDMSAKTACAE
jgi:hypothetical protein